MTARLLLINPNTSADMTRTIAADVAKHVSPDVVIEPVTAAFGARVIASRASYAIAAHAALDCFARHGRAATGIIVACFGDPGVAALRELASVPVIGLAEASVRLAGRRRQPFAIVTAGFAWKPMLTEFVATLPEADLFRGIFCVDATGLSVSEQPDRFVGLVADQIKAAQAHGAQTVILGGAAFAGFSSRLENPPDLIDCVAAAVSELLVMDRPPRDGQEDPPSLPSVGLADDLADLLKQGRSSD